MAKWLVTWVIDIENHFEDGAIGALEAAESAWKLRNNEDSTANVFTVENKDTGSKYHVDIQESHIKKVE